MSGDEKIPWWELPGAAGENRTKEQYDAMMTAAKEPNPNRKVRARLEPHDYIKAIRRLVLLFDEQGNMTADFSTMQEAVLGGYDVLSRAIAQTSVTPASSDADVG